MSAKLCPAGQMHLLVWLYFDNSITHVTPELLHHLNRDTKPRHMADVHGYHTWKVSCT